MFHRVKTSRRFSSYSGQTAIPYLSVVGVVLDRRYGLARLDGLMNPLRNAEDPNVHG
jgi:hypothetical protein